MRILHTSDWHAGKAWKGQSRLDELEAVLDDLAAAVERERVDLVLMTGDVFDTSSPSAEAERLVFRFFRRVGQLRVPSVVIAGNHDSPARVEAWAQLAELAQVTACGLREAARRRRLRDDDDGRGRACRHRRWCRSWRRRSSSPPRNSVPPRTRPARRTLDECSASFRRISAGFRPDAVNVLMAHTHLQGAAVGTSERRVHVAEEWAAAPAMLPRTAQYVALGHIHRHQQIMAAPVPTWYAGAPMQLDFGEEGETKAYNIVEATPGRPARVEPRPYVGARPLRTVTVTAAELVRVGTRIRIATRDEAPAPGADLFAVPIVDVSEHPHLRVIVDCTAGAVDPEINRKVRAAIPGVVSVDILRRGPVGDDAVTRPAGPDPGRGMTLAPRELYALFLQQHGASADEATLAAFDGALPGRSRVGGRTVRPIALDVQGFTCFREAQPTLDLSGLSLFAITGPTGAGKSSVLDAVTFALYGKVARMGRGSVKDLISHGRDRMSVTMRFSARDRVFVVTRMVRRNTGAGLCQLDERVGDGDVTVASGVREVDEAIERLVGLDYDAFTQAVVLPQGEFARFLKGAPAQRRQILQDLLRLTIYNRMQKLAGERWRDARRDVESAERQLDDACRRHAGGDRAGRARTVAARPSGSRG